MKNHTQIVDNAKAARPYLTSELMYDIVFVMNANSRGWILDKICRIIAEHSGLHCAFLYSERNDRLTSKLPPARMYFFAHYAIAYWAMVRERAVHRGRVFVWFTHPDPSKGITLEQLGSAFQHCAHIFCANRHHLRMLHGTGVPLHQMSAPIGGVATADFRPGTRGSGVVGFISAYYPRKQPEKMLALVRAMPDTPFMLIAPGQDDVENEGLLWDNFPGMSELRALPNFRYVPARYEEYPALYAGLDVYVSLSKLEGGPIPLIEALAANVVPVITRTGFAEEVIVDGENGYLIDAEDDVPALVAVVRQALAHAQPVHGSAEGYDWAVFAEAILAKMVLVARADERVEFGGGSAGAHFPTLDFSAADTGLVKGSGRSTVSVPFSADEPGPMAIDLELSAITPGGRLPTFVDITVAGQRVVVNREVGAACETVSALFRNEAVGPDGDIAIEIDAYSTNILAAESPKVTLHALTLQVPMPRALPLTTRFGRDYDGRPFAFEGWHEVEAGGIWSNAQTARLMIPVADVRPGDVLEVGVVGHAYAAQFLPDIVFSLTARLGGECAGQSWASPAGYAARAVTLTGAFAASADFLEVEIGVSRTTSPLKQKESPIDQRQLGFFLRELSIVRNGIAMPPADYTPEAMATPEATLVPEQEPAADAVPAEACIAPVITGQAPAAEEALAPEGTPA